MKNLPSPPSPLRNNENRLAGLMTFLTIVVLPPLIGLLAVLSRQ